MSEYDINPRIVCKDMDELDPEFRTKLEAALKSAKIQGLDPVVIETYRSQTRQDYLYAQGRTRPGGKVTWTRNSKHKSRKAADVCPRQGGTINWNWKAGFNLWGEIAERFGLEWGGRFKNYDGAHVQLD